MVKVRLYGSLRAIAKADEITVEADSLEAVLRALKQRYPALTKLIDSEGFVILVNGRPIPITMLGVKLNNEDEVDMLPLVSGGFMPKLRGASGSLSGYPQAPWARRNRT